jgi:hypothetical protein
VLATRLKEAAPALVGGNDHQLLLRFFSRFLSISDNPLYLFRLIQWNPAPALAANPALPDNSSESYNYSPSRYGERDALRFKAERDETRRELGEVPRKLASSSSNGSISASNY